MSRQLEFSFGAITHHHLLSMGNAMGHMQVTGKGISKYVTAAQSAKAVGRVNMVGIKPTKVHQMDQN